jgi:hypothetical protein
MNMQAWVEFPFASESSVKQKEASSLAVQKAVLESKGSPQIPGITTVFNGVSVGAGAFSAPAFISNSVKTSENYGGFLRIGGKFKDVSGSLIDDPHGLGLQFSITSSPFLNNERPISTMWNQRGIGETCEEWSFRKQDMFQVQIFNRNAYAVSVFLYLILQEIRW